MSSDPTMTFPATAGPARIAAPATATAAGAARRSDGPACDDLVVPLWSLVLAVVAFAPLLASRGVALRGDMVFVPGQALKGAWLGLDGWVAGAVPADFLVALGSLIVARRHPAEGHARRRSSCWPAPASARCCPTSVWSPGWLARRSTSGTRSSTSGCWSATGRSWSATRACRGSRGRLAG